MPRTQYALRTAYREVAPKNLGAVSDTISMSHFQFRDLHQIKLKSLLAPHITCLLVDMGSPGGVLSSIWRAAGWASIKITAFVIGNHLPQNGVIQSRPCSVPLLASSPYDVAKIQQSPSAHKHQQETSSWVAIRVRFLFGNLTHQPNCARLNLPLRSLDFLDIASSPLQSVMSPTPKMGPPDRSCREASALNSRPWSTQQKLQT